MRDWICEKTGAEVWLDQYRCYVRGDMFRLGEYGVLRVNNNTLGTSPEPRLLHYSVGTILHYFDKCNGVTGTMILTNIVYHGHDGVMNFASGPRMAPVISKKENVK